MFIFAVNTLPSRDKLNARTFKCIFLGYSNSQKGYKLYDLDIHKLIVSRDVTFYEDVFPYKDRQIDDNQIPITIFENKVSDDLKSESIVEEDTDDNHEDVTTEQNETTDANVPLRRSTRETRRPEWMEDYVTYMTKEGSSKERKETGSLYPLSCTTLDKMKCISTDTANFLASVYQVKEPSNYAQAKGHPEWEDAMKKELDALEKNNTWSITNLPRGKKAIG